MTEYLPCPHGRMPRADSHGWQSCPHCMGLNQPMHEDPQSMQTYAKAERQKWEDAAAEFFRDSEAIRRIESQAKQDGIRKCVEALEKANHGEHGLSVCSVVEILESLLPPEPEEK